MTEGREAEMEELREWELGLDKYPGNVADYSRLKKEQFEEIDISTVIEFARPGWWVQVVRPNKWVQVEGYERNIDWDLLGCLKDGGECVGFVHYVPSQYLLFYGSDPAYIGGYGVPIRRAKSE